MACVSLRRLAWRFQLRFISTKTEPNLPNKKQARRKTKEKADVNTVLNKPSASFTVKFFQKKCGFSLESALMASEKIQLNEEKKTQFESVIAFFKSQGFSNLQISKLVENRPSILKASVANNLMPKIDYLTEMGFKRSHIHALILKNDRSIFTRGLDSTLKPALICLKMFLGTTERVAITLHRASWLLSHDLNKNFLPNIGCLVKNGVQPSRISKLLTLQPRSLLHPRDYVATMVEKIKGFGLQPDAGMFMHALRVLIQLGDCKWKKKVELFKSYGFSEEEVVSLFVCQPHSLALSEKKLRSQIEFCLNTMKIEHHQILTNPMLIMVSETKRLRPRFYVLKTLEEQKLLKGFLTPKFVISDEDFMMKCINRYLDQVPDLLKIYNDCRNEVKIAAE